MNDQVSDQMGEAQVILASPEAAESEGLVIRNFLDEIDGKTEEGQGVFLQTAEDVGDEGGVTVPWAEASS